MSYEVLWDFMGKKVLYTLQKYYLFLFYISASVTIDLFFQISCKMDSVVLFKTTNEYLRISPSGEGEVSQSVPRTIAAEQFYSFVTRNFLLSR